MFISEYLYFNTVREGGTWEIASFHYIMDIEECMTWMNFFIECMKNFMIEVKFSF